MSTKVVPFDSEDTITSWDPSQVDAAGKNAAIINGTRGHISDSHLSAGGQVSAAGGKGAHGSVGWAVHEDDSNIEGRDKASSLVNDSVAGGGNRRNSGGGDDIHTEKPSAASSERNRSVTKADLAASRQGEEVVTSARSLKEQNQPVSHVAGVLGAENGAKHAGHQADLSKQRNGTPWEKEHSNARRGRGATSRTEKTDGVASPGLRGALTVKVIANVQSLVSRSATPGSCRSDRYSDISAEVNSLSKIHDEDEEIEIQHFILNHESSLKLTWDSTIMIIILWSSIANPMTIGFNIRTEGFILVVDIIMETFFLVDVGLNFRTSTIDRNTKEVITDPKKIALRYLKGWFSFDILSSLPVVTFSAILHTHSALEGYFIALKLLRTLKLHQLSVITNSFLKKFEDRDFNPTMFRIYLFVLWFLLVLHFIACGYWGISRKTDPEFEGVWTPEEYYLDLGVHMQYVRALYFAMVIIYGNDLKPDNLAEYAFSNLCLLVALVTNAVIIGSATNLLSNMDAGAVIKKSQMDSINGYLHLRKVPPSLQRKIRSFYEYMWDSGQDSHSKSLFEEMPEKLKLQLNVALKRDLIEKVPLFKTCSPAGTIALVQNLVSQIILPGELIVKQGEPATSMFFISRGTVSVFVWIEMEDEQDGCEREEKYVISLSDGSFFGEVALLMENHTRTANIRAETFVELQVLHAEDFRVLVKTFPEFEGAVMDVSKSRVKASDALTRLKRRGKFVSAANAARPRGSTGGRVPPSKRSSIATFGTVVGWAVNKSGRNGTMTETTGNSEGDNGPRRGISSYTSLRSAGFDYGAAAAPYRGLFDRVLAQEGTLSHESAFRVARGRGIRQETLLAIEDINQGMR